MKRQYSNRSARFSKGPKGRKEFEKWFKDQPQDFQEEWEENKDDLVKKMTKKSSLIPLKDYYPEEKKASQGRWNSLEDSVLHDLRILQTALDFNKTPLGIRAQVLIDTCINNGSLDPITGNPRGLNLVVRELLKHRKELQGLTNKINIGYLAEDIEDLAFVLTDKMANQSINQKIFEDAGQLSKVPSGARDVVQDGQQDGNSKDDVVSLKKSSFNASTLKPSQNTMVPINSVGMALGMINGFLDTDLGAIISSDNHIMDGHHRWAAAIMAYGKSASVQGYKAGVKGYELLRILNIITKGVFNRGGNSGSGNIKDFTPAAVEQILREGLYKGVTSTKGFNTKPEMVEKALTTLGGGDVEAGIQIMSANAKFINKNVPSWAPNRKDMPVINPEDVGKVLPLLNKGKVDWNAPYKNASLADYKKMSANVSEEDELLADLADIFEYDEGDWDIDIPSKLQKVFWNAYDDGSLEELWKYKKDFLLALHENAYEIKQALRLDASQIIRAFKNMESLWGPGKYAEDYHPHRRYSSNKRASTRRRG